MKQPTPSATDRSLGAELVAAIAARDFSGLTGLFTTPVTFRAVTPRRFFDADTAVGVADVVLGRWFAAERPVSDLLSLDTGRVGHVERLTYRLAVDTASGPAVIEQAVYFTEQDGRISDIRLVCSGFIPIGPRGTP
jgi:hypothetical protein